jgi:hypothetical protein
MSVVLSVAKDLATIPRCAVEVGVGCFATLWMTRKR